MTSDGRTLNRDRFEDDELARALRAYAEARLSPDQWATTRMRVAVVERANATLERRTAARTPRGRLWRVRIGTFVALVAVLAITTGATAGVAATPGGPLYGVRLWLEDQTLPASGAARADAQDAQIDERVDEATVSADERNEDGVSAALGAYGDELDAAFRDAGQDRAKLLHLESVISKHITVLQGLIKSNPTAAAAIQRAIDRSEAKLAQIQDRLRSAPDGGDGNANGSGNGGGNDGHSAPGDRPEPSKGPATSSGH